MRETTPPWPTRPSRWRPSENISCAFQSLPLSQLAGAVAERKRDPGQNKFRARSPPGDHGKEIPVRRTENSARIVNMAACGDHRPFDEKSNPSCRPEPDLNRCWFNSQFWQRFRWLRRRKWVVARVPQVECTVIKDSTGAEIAGEWDVYAFGVVVSMTTRQRHRNIETSSRSASTTERCSTPPTPCRRPVDSTWA